MGFLVSLGVLATLIWSFFSPAPAALAFVILTAVFEGYILLMSRVGRPEHIKPFSPPHYFNPDEVVVVWRYHLFFKFPFASQDFSRALSAIQLSTFIWVPWLLYQGLWLPAIAIAVNYFIAAPLAMQLNPRLFLSRATGAKALFAQVELRAINAALEKVTGQTRAE